MIGYQTHRLDPRLLPDSACLIGATTRLADVQDRPAGCDCTLRAEHLAVAVSLAGRDLRVDEVDPPILADMHRLRPRGAARRVGRWAKAMSVLCANCARRNSARAGDLRCLCRHCLASEAAAMTLVHPSGDEARDARDNTMGAERQILTAGGWVDKPSWREAREDQRDITAAIERDLSGSGVRVDGWELTHAAARRWADRNVTGGDA